MARETETHPRFLALLRGVNVGGKNIVPKDALRECFEDLEFTSVRTYIQSGNILFRSVRTDVTVLTDEIERALSERFSYHARAVVLSRSAFRLAVDAAPEKWGEDDAYMHHALFTLAETTPKHVLSRFRAPKPEFETVTAGPGVIYWSISRSRPTRSTWVRLPASQEYQKLTARNHNTVFRLKQLFEEI
ncbi:MAG: DUF1697 domain-containing protein [Candidatus Latescibacteria bacterium]|nr:DUF1697 domain-containing protein [Candidatus Latescibacterota bacterium]